MIVIYIVPQVDVKIGLLVVGNRTGCIIGTVQEFVLFPIEADGFNIGNPIVEFGLFDTHNFIETRIIIEFLSFGLYLQGIQTAYKTA